jgi:hypothetical protein
MSILRGWRYSGKYSREVFAFPQALNPRNYLIWHGLHD